MKFKSSSRRRALEYEKDWVERWKNDGTFEKSVEQRPADNSYVFYDGPPFITGVPHFGTLLSSIVKDAVPRYWTMKGKRVERRWGWDCHGLPAENFVEKQLGIVDRRDIGTKISLEDYIVKARDSMVANSESWEGVIDRVGRWVDFKGAYRTMDKDFMESVWWAFKTLYDAGKIYEGEKVLMYDTKFATPVSKAEVTMDNEAYQTVTDPSAYVKFKQKPGQKCHNGEWTTGENTYFIAWTTTPWTLPANMALAVNPKLEYAEVETDGERFVVAKKLVEQIFVDGKKQPLDYKIVREMSGSELVGLEYEPLFDVESSADAHKVYGADFVEDEGGTGIVHVAPAYGEDDFELAKKNNIPVLHAIDDNGYYLPEFAEKLRAIGVRDTDDSGIEVWAANKFIAKCLEEAGIVWKIDYIRHEYPFNPRSKQRIMYRAIPSWFFDIQNAKPLMLAQNENINWFPPHLKHGRFAKNIEQAPDWTLSRNRFWATAMPVWKGDRGTIKVIGSYAELKELSGIELDDYHRPWVDDVEFTIDGEHFKRVEEVLDGWFESGSMPFAQLHYPFENQEKFEKNYPADFIVEYIGQVRAWFYYVHAINTTLADIGAFGDDSQRSEKNAYKNVITTGTLAGNDGRKMSKSLGNFTDPNELMDEYSADSLRFLLLSCPVMSGEDFALKDKDVSDVARKLSMIWNMYDFFTMYAEVDGWEYNPQEFSEFRDELYAATFADEISKPALRGASPSLTGSETPSASSTEAISPNNLTNPLDKWIISRLHQLIAEVEKYMDEYNIPDAMSPILPFIDDASNWYVRRSRRRFWKSEDDSDKNEAYQTLHYVLAKLAQVLAPFTPFLAEELHSKLVGGESVHLLDWPVAGPVDEVVVSEMATLRDYVNQALSLRAGAGIKIRQPLASVTVPTLGKTVNFEDILTEELNVKEIKQGEDLALDFNITPELRREGLVREVIRHIQAARKSAGLNVDDRIRLALTTNNDELKMAINEHLDVITAETLATHGEGDLSHNVKVAIDAIELQIGLEKITNS